MKMAKKFYQIILLNNDKKIKKSLERSTWKLSKTQKKSPKRSTRKILKSKKAKGNDKRKKKDKRWKEVQEIYQNLLKEPK